MSNSRSTSDPPFRLRQESVRKGEHAPIATPAVLEAWPTGQGDYFLAGRDTYPIRGSISSVGARWDSQAKKWFVTRDQAVALGATILVRVLRAPVCCEKAAEGSVESLATMGEVLAERMTVLGCTYCQSHLREVVAIRDVLDEIEIPEPVVPRRKGLWEEQTEQRFYQDSLIANLMSPSKRRREV